VLTVALRNLTDMSGQVAQFGDVGVVYQFLPKDDLEARANFQMWQRDPGNPQAREWYCRSVLAKMDSAD
jgi:hypothetical protein